MNNDSILDKINKDLHEKTLKKIQEIKDKREIEGYINFESYNINILLGELFEVIKEIDSDLKSKNDLELTFVDRNKFDSDICIKIPSLLQKFKGGGYIKETIPEIIKLLEKSILKENKIIEKIENVGIYINITLGDKYLFTSLKDIFNKYKKYGENNLHKGESIVCDYSSPNVAKHLHAGHIRSTIIGHVLSNLYNANGYYTHRVNHINDWGGFGYLIEGYTRWYQKFKTFDSKNDMLFYIYTLYRKGEKISKSEEEYNNLEKNDLKELKKYYGDFSSFKGFLELFTDFLEASKSRFKALEKGKEEEVELWQEMVKWSMADFEKFYNLLGIHHDYLVGESFYSKKGNQLVEDLEKDKKVVFFTQKLANKDISLLNEKLDNGDITEKVYESTKEEILRDIGAYIIPLENFERYVVLKADKSSIYATRDLGAIKYRADTFSPSKIIYEVGQEQAEHFDKLFKSARKIGQDNIGFEHIYHGFYVYSKTKKKLSSRDGASNVGKLINDSISYFKDKYKDNESGFTSEEINDISYKIAIGSIIFNDIKSDKKNPVAISNDINETCASFEESGGAYVMYTIVRANSILRKLGNIDNITIENTEIEKLDSIEKTIINEINKYPLIVKLAKENNNPATLIEFILTLSRAYNSYYNSHRVINDDKIVEYRVSITKAVIITLTNAMNICHIQIPNKI